MDQGQRLKYLIDHSDKSNTEVARLSGISEAALYLYFKQKEIDSNKLQKICKVMGWGLEEFFPEFKSSELLRKENETLKRENALLKSQLADKEKIIALLGKKK